MMGARYYIPWLCRWSASDPLESKYARMSPYNYSFNNPVMFNDPSGMEGEDALADYEKGRKAFVEGEERTKAKFQDKLNEVANSKASDEFKKDFAALGLDGLLGIRNSLFEAKLKSYDTGIAVALYGRNDDGSVAVPESIRQRLWTEAHEQTVHAYKVSWAMGRARYDPNKISDALNPVKHIKYKYNFALTVSNKSEGWDVIYDTLKEVGISWALHFAGGGLSNLRTSGKVMAKSYQNAVIANAQKEVGYVRTSLGVKNSQNIAISEGKIGNDAIREVGISGKTKEFSTGIPEPRQFHTEAYAKFDSEVKILETLATRYQKTPMVKGNISLISERAYCPSCQNVIKQFQQKFPNINIRYVSGWVK